MPEKAAYGAAPVGPTKGRKAFGSICRPDQPAAFATASNHAARPAPREEATDFQLPKLVGEGHVGPHNMCRHRQHNSSTVSAPSPHQNFCESPTKKAAPRPILWRENADARSAPDLIERVEHVHHIEAQRHRLDARC